MSGRGELFEPLLGTGGRIELDPEERAVPTCAPLVLRFRSNRYDGPVVTWVGLLGSLHEIPFALEDRHVLPFQLVRVLEVPEHRATSRELPRLAYRDVSPPKAMRA